MKIKIRAEDASTLNADSWLQLDQWLADLRDDSGDEPLSDNAAQADDAGRYNDTAQPDGTAPGGAAQPGGTAQADATAQARTRALALAAARAEAHARAVAEARAWAEAQAAARADAQARALIEARAHAEAQAEIRARAASSGRALIGDQLRIPVMWCELGSCIAWFTDRAALGEADNRARAIAAGWRIDGLGRLACPQCQQHDPGFWTSAPLVPWDRYSAMVRAAHAAGAPPKG